MLLTDDPMAINTSYMDLLQGRSLLQAQTLKAGEALGDVLLQTTTTKVMMSTS